MLPVKLALRPDGEPLVVSIDTRKGSIKARVWRATVGRCTLLLLDSDVEGNLPEDRALTARLYGGDRRVRIRQELLLGVAGYRALPERGITPGALPTDWGRRAFAPPQFPRPRVAAERVAL